MYAMKYCSKSLCIKKDAFRNVLREMELLARLENPFIVNLWYTFQVSMQMQRRIMSHCMHAQTHSHFN